MVHARGLASAALPSLDIVDAMRSTTAHLMDPSLQGHKGGFVHTRTVGDMTLHLGVSSTKRVLDLDLPGNGGLRVWSYKTPDLAVSIICFLFHVRCQYFLF